MAASAVSSLNRVSTLQYARAMWLQNNAFFSAFFGCFPIRLTLGFFRVVFRELRRDRNANRYTEHKHTIPGRAARFDVYIAGFGQTVRPVIADKVSEDDDDVDDD